jgi:hypothetical protein
MTDPDSPRQSDCRAGATRDNNSAGATDAATDPRQPTTGSPLRRQNRDRNQRGAGATIPHLSRSVGPPEPVQAGDDRNYCAKPGPPRADNSFSPCNDDLRCHCAAPLGAAQIRAVPGGVGLSTEEIRALPAAFAFDPVVPAAFGLSRSAAYRALAAGQLPIRTLRLGHKLIVTRADLMAALGVEEAPPSPAGSADGGQDATATWGTRPVCDNNKEGNR